MTERRVVLVHGFTGTNESWDDVAAHLMPYFEIAPAELPGHGKAGNVRLTFEEAANAIGDSGGKAAYVGYSMGGRLCLRLAIDRPDLVSALVLIGASPGLATAEERVARREADERLAATIEGDGTEKFLQRWLTHPLFATLDPSPEELARRQRNPPDGLASALRLLGPGAQEPLWDRLGEVRMPVLLMVGERDKKFLATSERMIESGLPARLATVPHAGHAVHLEAPIACGDIIRKFLLHGASE
ncbi:MAG TPA: alpha/beta fold hydrolase [Acidimicrobiales bacterium]|nr:alpha/beta fold hydrolase [Acidimicrobiales bacterium]